MEGALVIDGKQMEIDGLGLRDHSWGPRYWQAIKSYRWLNCTFVCEKSKPLSAVNVPCARCFSG